MTEKRDLQDWKLALEVLPAFSHFRNELGRKALKLNIIVRFLPMEFLSYQR